MVPPKKLLILYPKKTIYLRYTYTPSPPPTLRNRVTCCCSKAWRRCCKRCRASRVSISKRFRRSSLLPSKQRNATPSGELVGGDGDRDGWCWRFLFQISGFCWRTKKWGKVAFNFFKYIDSWIQVINKNSSTFEYLVEVVSWSFELDSYGHFNLFHPFLKPLKVALFSSSRSFPIPSLKLTVRVSETLELEDEFPMDGIFSGANC